MAFPLFLFGKLLRGNCAFGMDRIKIISYNVDGLPSQIDLRLLPWVLRPVAWIYKLVKGTTIVKVNDNQDVEQKARKIGQMIAKTGADIVAVQEDFNYHAEMMSEAGDGYNCATHTGGFDISRLFSTTEWWSRFPLPRFKADGLNILTRKNRVKVYHERIIGWEKSCGYISHANDLLTHKGFRHYIVRVGDCPIDLYVVHMDADFYYQSHDAGGDVEARRSQFGQLSDYIKERLLEGAIRPVIIVGDTNCRMGNVWDDSSDILHERLDGLREALAVNYTDVDRLFYINNPLSTYELTVVSCQFEKSVRLSDHYPLVVEFEVSEREK